MSVRARLLQALRGELAVSQLNAAEGQALLGEALVQGVSAQLWARWRHTPSPPDWLAALPQRLRLQMQWELAHQFALSALLDRLQQAGVAALVLKGSALAYQVYAQPADRMRGDSDVLVAPEQREAATDVLAAAGFKALGSLHGGDTQQSWQCIDAGGARHCIDLHWQPINSPLFERDWCFAVLIPRSIPLPALAPSARTLDRVDACLHACMHWAINRHVPYHVEGVQRLGGNRLIWLLDLQLLAESLNEAERATLRQRALELGVGGLVRAACSAAVRDFPSAALQALQQMVLPQRREWRSWALSGGWYRRAFAEFCALGSRQRRWAWLKGQLGASTAELRARWPHSRAPLWWLWWRRLWTGLLKRARR